MSEKIRVLLADDHAVLRSGLKALIDAEPDLEVVGEAANGREAVEWGRGLGPDVVGLEIPMPEMDGPAAAKAVRETEFAGHIVMLTMHAGEEHLSQALKAGAS